MGLLVLAEIIREDGNAGDERKSGDNELETQHERRLIGNDAENPDHQRFELQEQRGEGARQIAVALQHVAEADRQSDEQKPSERSAHLRDGDEIVVPDKDRGFGHRRSLSAAPF